MEKVTRVARGVLLGSAGLALVVGVVIWIADAYSLVEIHELLGYALVASLWALAWIAARSGVPIRIVAAAAAWGVLALVLGWTQNELLPGDAHWVVQVLHPVISMASVPWGKRLASLIARKQAGDVVVVPPSSRLTISARGRR